LPDANLAKVFLQVLNNDVETGTENVDTLTGTSNSEVINALAGDDVIVANGGSDMIDGGAGDDSIHINADNIAHLDDVVLDGGTGTDTLYLVGSSLTLDFTSLASQHVQNIEVIEITGSGDNILEIDASDVLELSSTTDVLKVLGDSGDSVDVATTMLTTGVTHTEDGVTYHVYADTSVAAELWLDVDLSVI
jgi:Ca2+-binding RTX toxin-like protein